ncbi:MAG: PAS domain-containing protein, partial [Melioribacteraceae bacterium]|nr:PAS domain-containing protein [Melioribacteraceae bacterium]
AEEELKKNEEKYRLITDSTSDYLFSAQVPKEGNSTMDWVSNSFEKITGYTLKEFINGGSWAASIHPEDVSVDRAAFEELKNNKKAVIEVRIFDKKREIIWIRCSTTPVWSEQEQRVVSIYGAAKDITEEKNAELEVQKSEAKYRLITNLTSDYLFSTSINKNGESIPTWVGGSFKEITGYTFEEYKKIGGWNSMLHPDDLLKDREAFKKLENNKKVKIEVRTFHKSGKIVWVEIFSSPVWDEKMNKLIGINGACTDITKEKLASIALKESEEKYKLISNITSDYLFESRLNAKNKLETVWVAGSFEKMTGYKLEEYKEIGGWSELLYKDDVEIDLAGLEKLKQNKETIIEVRTHNKDGRIIWIRNTCSPVWDEKNNKFLGVIGAVKDISEEKQNQIIQEVQYNIANAIVKTPNDKKLFQTVKDELNKILDTTNFYIAFYDEKSRMLTSGIDSDEKDNIETWPVEKSISGVVINSNKKLLVNNKEILELADSGKIEIFGTVSEVWLGVPLKVRDKAIGIMAVQDYEGGNAYDKISVD